MKEMIKHGYGYGMNRWMDILSEDAIAPETGLYMFACKGDNHVLHEFYALQKGERLCKYFEGEYGHSNGFFGVCPIAFHYVEEYSPLEETKVWRKFEMDDIIALYGFFVLALAEKAVPDKVYYAVLDLSGEYRGMTWKKYLQERGVIHAGVCSFDYTGCGYLEENYRKFNIEEIDILAYSCIFRCAYDY